MEPHVTFEDVKRVWLVLSFWFEVQGFVCMDLNPETTDAMTMLSFV